MRHNDDAFTAMLLSLPLTANKEELVRPLSSAEFSALAARVSASRLKHIGALMNMDISDVMRTLDVTESEAYRICMLLSRSMPLSYAMERFYEQNLELLTIYDAAYPDRITTRLDVDAPAAMYTCGDISLLNMPLIGILGISGVKMSATIEENLRVLVRGIIHEGFGIITSSELGAARFAESEALACGGKVVCTLAGDLLRKKEDPECAKAIRDRNMLLLSLVHPDAPHTIVHALTRNRLVYALPSACFIATTDGKRGESEALRRHFSDWMYVFDMPDPPGNRQIISRGITPIYDIRQMDFSQYARNWRMAEAEQLKFL